MRKGEHSTRKKLQSAMEFMMTYGWALLIIAVVLAGMFSLGIFNPATFAPKAHPGSCVVYRPDGPFTTSLISLSGSCTNQLPQFVAEFSGANSYISLGNDVSLSPEAGANGKMTLCMWYNILSTTNYHGPLLKGKTGPSNGTGWEYTLDQTGNNQQFAIWNSGGSDVITRYAGGSPVANEWHMACFTFDHSTNTAYYYLDGVQYDTTGGNWAYTASAAGGNLTIGYGEGGFSRVQAANLQIYSEPLSSSDITALYSEGIGGAPVNLNSLVGWWPMNGNANDYSGNQNDGSEFNVSYTGSWTSAYTMP